MANYYWTDWYTGWGWVLWFGFVFLCFSAMMNWGYSYKVHRNFRYLTPGRDALDILSEQYAQGELRHEQFEKARDAILNTMNQRSNLQSSSRTSRGSTFGKPIKVT